MNLRITRRPRPHFFLFIFFLITSNVFSQCFEIQSILVDACDGTFEGLNEMVRFKVGNAPLDTNTLTVSWPNTTITWKGLVQNGATAAKVAQLNADIAAAGGCGQIVEPPLGILPANATGILVTSYQMDTNANSFGPLSETIYMIFQNSTIQTGHFANYTTTPPNNRTLVMNFVGSCSDTAIYDKSQLTDINGNTAAANGATVNFTPSGVASYTNSGCKAPVPPFNVDAGPVNLAACAGSTITLNGAAVGQQSVAWSSASGSFSSPTTTTTDYTIPTTAGGTTIVLTLQATNSCGLQITDVINLAVNTNVTPNFVTSLTLCSSDTAPVLALTSPNGITGTWNPAVINTITSGNYIFTPTAGQCATTATLAVTITPETIPDFATTLTLCNSDTAPVLALTSPNGITGTWNPAVISTITSGNYIFTPTAGQCATTATLAVTINPETTPDFATSLNLCATDIAPTLALTSPNGITGTWNPAVISTITSGNYIFTPNNGQCATTATLAVNITPETTPDFATTLTLCSSDAAPVLAITSPNGITGTWNPAVISTTTSANYTFTPTAGQCATTATLAVTVNPETIPDFATSLILCTIDIAPTLALTSPNGITGTWNPAIISTTTSGNYIFTPNAGQCATTATLAVTITTEAIPDFATSLTLCTTDIAPMLALTSPNGITGTWNPAVISAITSENYIFTPNSGQCVTTATLAVTINPETTPDFATSLTLCTTDIAPTLALTSPNGITGTWNPTIINTTTIGNYIFTPTAGQCATTATLAVTVNPETTPDFATTLALCSSNIAPVLALTSPNGITGTWNPAVISTTTSGNYIFTPNNGQCATTATLAVTITPETIPDFATSLTLCANDIAPTLALTSPNGITGTWNPSIINTTTSGNYIFTPTAGQCATTATLAVIITPEIIPNFATTLTLCTTDIAPTLALISPNGITGTWNPAVISTTTSGNYIFTPTAGQCAATATLAIIITTEATPDFATTLTLCANDIAPTLALTSPNGITGTWNPSIINTTNSGNYIFTPTAGQCAATATLAIIITTEATPDFATTLTLCANDIAPTLALTSPNGITGTWNPSIINTTNSGNYIFTPTAGQCATTAILAVTVNPETIPDFATSLTLCTTDIAPTLALTSPNGITGTWNPAVISTTTSGNYIFTPTAGQCSTTATLAITITPETTPDFATTLTLCANDIAPTLALTSPNGITGTWNPAVISTTTSGNYIFTPNNGQCATTATLAVTITTETIPDFATSLTLCTTDIAPTLALTSPNGITGTWNPAVISTTTSGNYIFTPTVGQCATTATLTVTVNPETIPDFATSLTLCTTDIAPTLALTSPNGITGTWNPAVISTTTSGNYIFTPTAGQCATTATLAVTVNPETIPDFATSLTLCTTDIAPTLALTSPNGITGTWNPAVISTTTSGNYIFTPNAGQSSTTATLAITITPETTPDFATTLTLCTTDIAPTLALTSPNGITGTWNPAVISTTTSGNYIFTPTAGQCATTATLAVTVNPETIPDFATSLTLCNSATAPVLALTSPNGIIGTWNPAVISTTASGNYIFTPNSGQCATTANLAVTINPEITPDFATSLTLCTTDIAPTLALTSPIGITGTWNPAVISTTTSGNYIFTPTAGQCATTATLAITITPETIPDFATSLILCTIDIAPTLALTSPNGITGTWNPAVISTTTSGNYIFTPNNGQCSTTATLAVTITTEAIPDFATSLTLCTTDIAPMLALTSPNGITGTWNPAVISTTTSGNYIFTPNAGQCSTTATLAITITPETTPDFATTLTLCANDIAPTLALTSPNGITGTWNPAIISTTTSSNYIFTPTAGQCATATTLAVTITPFITPDFATTLTLCSRDTTPTLATTSPNGITGTWNPAVINTTTSGNYIFTPTAGLCAVAITLAVDVTPISYEITQECVDNKYLIKAKTESSASNYSFTWFNEKGDQIGLHNETFDFTEYSKNYNNQLVFPLQFKVMVSNGSCESEQLFEIANNLCGVPNAVSPNGDGINDSFDLTEFNVSTLTIYNRWGRKVYDFHGKYDRQWHGQWSEGNTLPTGTYYYIISSENGDQKAGWVYLSY